MADQGMVRRPRPKPLQAREMAKKCVVSVLSPVWSLPAGPPEAVFQKKCAERAISAITPYSFSAGSSFSAADSSLSSVGPLRCRCTSCGGGGGGRLAASAPQFQSGWRIPLKAPIELSNINVFKRFRNYCGLYQLRNRCSPEADDREAAAEDDANYANYANYAN